mgnify:CR=1 FL=1
MGKDGNRKVIKAALLGSIAGTVMGLLLAPKSGQELRQDLTAQTQKLGDKALELKDMAQDALQIIEEKTQVGFDTGKNWLEKKTRLFDNLKTLVSEIQHGALTKDGPANSPEAKKAEPPIIEATLVDETIVVAMEDATPENAALKELEPEDTEENNI